MSGWWLPEAAQNPALFQPLELAGTTESTSGLTMNQKFMLPVTAVDPPMWQSTDGWVVLPVGLVLGRGHPATHHLQWERWAS